MGSSEDRSVANRELCQQFLDAYRPDRLLRDGLIVRIVGHSDPADALAAVVTLGG